MLESLSTFHAPRRRCAGHEVLRWFPPFKRCQQRTENPTAQWLNTREPKREPKRKRRYLLDLPYVWRSLWRLQRLKYHKGSGVTGISAKRMAALTFRSRREAC